jgi:hypothetical protein
LTSCGKQKTLDLSAANHVALTHAGLSDVSLTETKPRHFVGTGTKPDGTVYAVDVSQAGRQVNWSIETQVKTPESTYASRSAGATTAW